MVAFWLSHSPIVHSTQLWGLWGVPGGLDISLLNTKKALFVGKLLVTCMINCSVQADIERQTVEKVGSLSLEK